MRALPCSKVVNAITPPQGQQARVAVPLGSLALYPRLVLSSPLTAALIEVT